MAVVSSTLVINLNDLASAGLARLDRNIHGFGRGMDKANGKIGGMAAPLVAASTGIVAMGGALISVKKGIEGTVGGAIAFEEAFSDVKKVVDGTPEQFADLNSGLLDMSRDMPVAATGLATIMAAAGQANVPIRELLDYTQLAAEATTAWGMSAEATGEGLAKIRSQLGLNNAGTRRYADTINHLSNTTASSASDLVEYARRVAKQGEDFGLTREETLAFGAAMIGSGAEADVAATSFRNMGKMLARGGAATKSQRAAFRDLGLDAEHVAKVFSTDAVGAFELVAATLASLKEEDRAVAITTLFGVYGEEARALIPLVSNVNLLRDALAKANSEAVDGSVSREFAERAKTTRNAIQRMQNNFRALGIEVGSRTLPAIANAANFLSDRLSTADERVDSLTQRLGAGWGAFSDGLGLDATNIGDALGRIGSSIDQFVFGSSDLEAGKANIAGIADAWGDLGAAVSMAMGGDITGGIGALADAMTDLDASTAGLGTAGVAVAAGAISTLGLALLKLGGGLLASRFGQIAVVTGAIANMVKALKDADGDIVAAVQGMDRLSQAMVGLAAAFVAFKGMKLGRGAARGIKDLRHALGKTPLPAEAAKAGAKGAGKAAPAAAKVGAKLGPKGKAGIVVGGLAAGAYLLGGGSADAAEVSSGATPKAAAEAPGLWERVTTGLSDAVSLLERRIAEDPEGFEKIAKLFSPAITAGEMAANAIKGGGQPPASVPGAGSLAPRPEATAAPVIADPAQMEAEASAADKLIAAATRLAELRASATTENGFRGNLLTPDARAEMQSLNAQVGTMSQDMGMPELRAQVQELSRLLASASPEAAAAADGIRAALANAGQQGGEGLRQGVQQGVDGAIASLTGVGARFFAAGSEIANQLAAGIRANIGAVDQAAAAMVDRVAAKVPQSPAREGPLRGLPYAGAEIVRQLAGGMSNTGPVEGAAARVAGLISSMTQGGSPMGLSANVGAPSGPGGGGGGGGINVSVGGITISGASGDPQAIAQEVKRVLESEVLTAIQSKFGDVI
ncbi:TP901 family phage tail tape measure protein [Stappia sp. 22II-S9-Z10]|nr:TP901 family phage tail tape measure protein [Stappia sp. 22II-S9-Z10]